MLLILMTFFKSNCFSLVEDKGQNMLRLRVQCSDGFLFLPKKGVYFNKVGDYNF